MYFPFRSSHARFILRLAIATGPVRQSREPWPDRAYPYQMDVEFLSVPELAPSIRPPIGELDLFGRTEQGWGRRLQTTLRELSEHDFGILSRAAADAKAGPEL